MVLIIIGILKLTEFVRIMENLEYHGIKKVYPDMEYHGILPIIMEYHGILKIPGHYE